MFTNIRSGPGAALRDYVFVMIFCAMLFMCFVFQIIGVGLVWLGYIADASVRRVFGKNNNRTAIR
jgi:hypothetical protein